MEKTIKGFINEMSYKLNMEEIETIIIDYQDTIIDFIVNHQYVAKYKREMFELCEVIRSDKFFKTISVMIQAEDERIQSDMAYVLFTATNYNCVDEEMKAKALQLGYQLREMEFGHDMVKDQATNTCILISKVKAVQWFETTPHIRSKSVENIVKSLPTMLYSAYHERYKATEIPTKVILAILTKAVPELRPEEIVTAFCKTEFPKDLNTEVRQFALRVRAFIYELCGRMSEEELLNALRIASVSMTKFNERTNLNESFVNKYLDYRLLVNIYEDCKKNKAKFPTDMLKALQVIAKFIKKNVKFKPLF